MCFISKLTHVKILYSSWRIICIEQAGRLIFLSFEDEKNNLKKTETRIGGTRCQNNLM